MEEEARSTWCHCCFWQGRLEFEACIALEEEAAVCVKHLLGEGKLQLFQSLGPMTVAEE